MTCSHTSRAGDAEPWVVERDDRYFCLDGGWYFATREGLAMGPYESRARAVAETELYIQFITSAPPGVAKLLTRNHGETSALGTV